MSVNERKCEKCGEPYAPTQNKSHCAMCGAPLDWREPEAPDIVDDDDEEVVENVHAVEGPANR